ncbi:MAG: hypothetical protein E6Q97_06795 [Desulfurellales bacterium]|nr:MAG: hypothetical protein E6Q97_06795 [Desulfurellales bacterium]
MSLEDLKGKTISKVLVSEDKTFIAFESEETKELFVFVLTADCCSSTQLEGVATMGLPARVEEVRDFTAYTEDDDIDEHTQHYRVILRGERGDVVKIRFCNSSNGYYGGSLEKYEADYDRSKLKLRDVDGE